MCSIETHFLSYKPVLLILKNRPDKRLAYDFMVENRGFEPLTSWLPAMRSPS